MPSYTLIAKDANTRFVDLPSTGRYDIYVQGVFNEPFEGLLTFSLGDPSAKISGIIKLSQQFLITLLTTPGSDLFEPNRGTEMANLIGSNFYDREEVRIIVTESVRSAARQVIDQQVNFPPQSTDESLNSAEIIRLDVIGDEVYPYILITSDAGKYVDVKLPGLNVF